MTDYTGMTPEQIKDELIKRDEELKTATQHLDTATKANSESVKRIKDLEEHNQKLFLKVTTKVEDKPEEDKDKNPDQKMTFEGLAKIMNGDDKDA